MPRLLSEERQQVQGQVRPGERRPGSRPKAVFRRPAEKFQRQTPVRRMERDTGSCQCVIQTQFPVFPRAEKQAAPQLLEERTRPHFQQITVPGSVQTGQPRPFQFGRITGQGLGIPFRLQAGRKTAPVPVQLQVIVGTPWIRRAPNHFIFKIIDGA